MYLEDLSRKAETILEDWADEDSSPNQKNWSLLRMVEDGLNIEMFRCENFDDAERQELEDAFSEVTRALTKVGANYRIQGAWADNTFEVLRQFDAERATREALAGQATPAQVLEQVIKALAPLEGLSEWDQQSLKAIANASKVLSARLTK
jgi:hypothetical protein